MGRDRGWGGIRGASSGIEGELRGALGHGGYALGFVPRRQDRLDRPGRGLKAPQNSTVDILTLDLEGPAASVALHDTLVARGIEVHTLVNNAGFGLRGKFSTLPYDRQMAMVELNVTALTKLSRLMLPGMVERRRGGI